MTWTINLSGHDDMVGDEKKEFEEGLVDEVKELLNKLNETENVHVSVANVTTNTTGSVNLREG